MGKTTYLLMTLAGLFGISAGVSPVFRAVGMLGKLGSTPLQSTVAAAPQGRWVTLTDAKLRCESLTVYKDQVTFFLATDAGLANPFLAQFIGKVTCEQASAAISGAFLPERLTMADLAEYGVDAKGATDVRLFAPVNPQRLRGALVPLVGIMLIGAGIAAFGVRGLLRARARKG